MEALLSLHKKKSPQTIAGLLIITDAARQHLRRVSSPHLMDFLSAGDILQVLVQLYALGTWTSTHTKQPHRSVAISRVQLEQQCCHTNQSS